MTTKTEAAASLARETAVLSLFKLYRYLDGKADRGLTSMYLSPIERFAPEAAKQAYEAIRDGGVPEAVDWLPTVPRWVGLVRAFERLQNPHAVILHNGLLSMDFGLGRVDMRGLTTDEQDEVMRLGGKSADGRNMALMDMREKRAALKGLPAPSDPKRIGITPAVRKM